MTDWIKASMSGDQGACVEQRSNQGMIEVRDTKNRLGPVLSFTPAEFAPSPGAVSRTLNGAAG